MDKRAFFVIGSEGSGTNMLAEAFVSAGCHYEPRHNSHLEDYEFEKMPDLLVFRRSVPHAHQWPDIAGIWEAMKTGGFAPRPLLILRDWYSTIQSVLRRDPEAHYRGVEVNMRRTFELIPQEMYWALIVVSYESFCLHPEFRKWLFVERLGLKEPEIEIAYANNKYYKEG